MFRISPADRVSIVGKTGSGKSFFVKRLLKEMEREAEKLNFYYPIIVLDNKGSPKTFQGFGKRIKKLKDLKKSLAAAVPVIVYSPQESERTMNYYAGFFEYLYKLNEPMLIYVDEFTLLGKGENIPEYVEKFYKQGRERLQALWAATQNPVYLSHDVLSQADHYFVFDLLNKSDRERMAAMAGDQLRKRPNEIHGFWYFGTSERNPEYFPNVLTKNVISTENVSKEQTKNSEETEGESVKGKYIVSIFILGLVMVFVLPLWKTAFKFLAAKVPATQPIATFTEQA